MARRLTQEELAELAGVDNKTISRLENGHYNVGIDLVARLARSLEVPSSSLLPSRGW